MEAPGNNDLRDEYYVYTPDRDPMNASGVIRATILRNSIVDTHRLADGKWVQDLNCYGDIIGITGTTRVKKVSKPELRRIIEHNSDLLDASEVLDFSRPNP